MISRLISRSGALKHGLRHGICCSSRIQYQSGSLANTTIQSSTRPLATTTTRTTPPPPPSLSQIAATTTAAAAASSPKYQSLFGKRVFYNFESSWQRFKNYLLFGGIGLFWSSLLLSGVMADGSGIEWQGAPRVGLVVKPDNFAPEDHFYPRVLNAQLHPMVRSFLEIGTKRIVERYCHLHPGIDSKALTKLLHYKPKYLHWAGADLFVVTNNRGERQLCVIETNTCPSGQKSMPIRSEMEEHGGYQRLLQKTFKQLMLDNVDPSLYGAGLAVMYDKNSTETTGYAATLADVTGEDVYLVEYYDNDKNPPVKFENGTMYVRTPKGNPFLYVAHSAKTAEDETREKEYLEKARKGDIEYDWVPIRAAFRYVTQKPWSRIPIQTKTRVLNPVVVCLAGGRNKNIAAKAYDIFNAQLMVKSGLQGVQIATPKTEKDVDKLSIDLLLKQFGGVGVIKVPYMNAGQGVYTITSEEDLAAFHKDPVSTKYDKFIVQSLIGNSTWSSKAPKGVLYHVGTVPDKRGAIYAADIRMMIHYTQDEGWVPLSVYSRRARSPLAKDLKADAHDSSWDMLGTNLSVKLGANKWRTDVHRLMIMDSKDFNKLGIGMDDLISGYVQTVLAAIAIDQMAQHLITEDGSFNFDLFQGLNDDNSLIDEFKFNQNLEFKPTKLA